MTWSSSLKMKKIRSLIEERRNLIQNTSIDEPQRQNSRKSICKEIQKLVRRRNRLRKAERIRKILADFKGLKKIPAIRDPKGNKRIDSMRDANGKLVTAKQEVADVFALFYETLYTGQPKEVGHALEEDECLRESLEPITLEELRAALALMKRGKAKDENGIIAEMLKDGSTDLISVVRGVFNDILLLRKDLPEEWRKTKLVVIFKKGDPTMAANYRPIAILPILYKLFSRVLCSRLQEYLMPHQSVDQAAYRKGFSAADHLLTVAQLIERSNEFNFPVWLALVDFEKAFDTVEHGPLWEVLKSQGVPVHYIVLLKRLYRDQTASVQAGTRSRTFSISRGVKQGDPISALLFIAIMQACFSELQGRWANANKRRTGVLFGISIAPGIRNLTELRFADDVILVAQSKSDVTKMLQDLATFSAKYGLKLHFGKTKIMTWNALSQTDVSVSVEGQCVTILDEATAERYLGRKLAFRNCQATEIANRIAAGWAAFTKHKSELCCKEYLLRDRLRLFDAVVTPAVLYACSTWALTKTMEKKLQVTRRRMLRFVFRIFRKKVEGESEDWVDYLRRANSRIQKLSTELGAKEWVETQRCYKWRFAGELARQTDSRWSQLVLDWKPHWGQGRSRGHPTTRWSDQIEQFAGGDWMAIAADPDQWELAESGFVTHDNQFV